MLVLTRKQNEKVCIGDSITITVLRMKGKAVRLGIEAPRDVNVLRGELVFESSDDGNVGTSSGDDSDSVSAPQVKRLSPGQAAGESWTVGNHGAQTVAVPAGGFDAKSSPLNSVLTDRVE